MSEGRALARAALAGNPSDVYGGAVLGITVPGMGAEVRIAAANAPSHQSVTAPDLVDATLARFAREFPDAGGVGDTNALAVSVSTTIPRSVGLGGSSAIVIALLRALCDQHSVELSPPEMAELALSIERDDLGITAGLQDRVTQTYEGALFMDFAAHHYERLDCTGLPPLLIAWRSRSAAPSGQVHSRLLERWQAGDRVVHESIATLAALARSARDAIVTRDYDKLRRCVDGSYDARARMLTLNPAHVEMIEVARASGAAANYAGSGGAIVCVCRDDDQRGRLITDLSAANCGTRTVDLSS